MKHCPHCAAPFDGLVPFCWHCGRDATDSLQAFTPEPAASDAVPATTGTTPPVEQVISRSSDVEIAPAQVDIAANRQDAGYSLGVASGGVLAGRVDTGHRPRGGGAPAPVGRVLRRSDRSCAGRSPPCFQPAAGRYRADNRIAPSPTWAGARRATWARDGRKPLPSSCPPATT